MKIYFLFSGCSVHLRQYANPSAIDFSSPLENFLRSPFWQCNYTVEEEARLNRSFSCNKKGSFMCFYRTVVHDLMTSSKRKICYDAKLIIRYLIETAHADIRTGEPVSTFLALNKAFHHCSPRKL